MLNRPPFCVKCSRFLENPEAGNLCRACLRFKPAFDFAWAACLYEEPLKELIHRFKYGQKTGLRHLFVPLITGFIQRYHLDIAQFDCLMPVPLAGARLRERGYNQALLLAQGIGKRFSIPLETKQLIRVRHTRPQSLLEEKERWTNIRGAFRIKHLNAVKGRNILIIDDLLTTGATTSAAADVLKRAAAGTVGVLTLAITH